MRRSRGGYIAIWTAALALRLIGLNKGIWLDEYAALDIISREPLAAARAYDYPPAYFLLLKAWSAAGTGESTLRLLSVILGMGTLIIATRWVAQIDLNGGPVTGTLLATSPILLRYSQEIQTYPLLLLATAGSFYFAGRLSSAGHRDSDFVGLGASLSLAACTQLVGSMVITSAILYLMLAMGNRRRIFSWQMLLTMGLPALLFGFIFYFYLGNPEKQDWWIPFPDANLIRLIIRNEMGWEALLDFLTRARIASYDPARGLLTIVMTGMLGTALWGSWRRGYTLLAAAAFYWMQLLVLSVLRTPIFWYHVAQVGLIPFFGFLGIQIATIRTRPVRMAGLACTLLIVLGLGLNWVLYAANRPIEEWRRFALALQAQWTSEDVLLVYPHYVDGPIRYYVPALESQRVIQVWFKATDEEIRAIGNEVALALSRADTEQRARVFLAVREDQAFLNNPETYAALLDLLERKYGDSILVADYGGLRLLRYGNQPPGDS